VPLEIDSVAWAVVDSHLRDPFPDTSDVSGISSSETFDSRQDASSPLDVPELIDPTGEPLSLADLNHD
jgi:hypothetical protein